MALEESFSKKKIILFIKAMVLLVLLVFTLILIKLFVPFSREWLYPVIVSVLSVIYGAGIFNMYVRLKLDVLSINGRSHSFKYLKTLFLISPNPLLVIQCNTFQVSDYNESALEYFALEDNSLIDKDIRGIFNKEFSDEVTSMISTYRENNLIPSRETTLVDAKGQTHQVEISANGFRFLKKDYVFLIIRDISLRKQVEHKLRESEEKYRSMMEAITDDVYICSPDYKISYMNPSMEKRLGKDSLYKPCHEVLFGEVSLCKNCAFDKVRKGEHVTNVLHHPKDEKIYQVSHAPVYHSNGKISKMTVYRDITQVTKTKEQAEGSQRKLMELIATKDKFFSIIAHDLKNPFNSLIGFSDLLLHYYSSLDQEEIINYLGLIHKTSKQGYSLLENLLQWARSQTGNIELKPEFIDLNELFNDKLLLFMSLAEKKKIKLKAELGDNIYVYADINMVKGVLRNLISNAIKFTPEKGKITLSARGNGEFTTISVEDTGIGMAEKDKNKLFRLDVHHTTIGTGKEKGTGLGLILCKEFVEKNGGKIWVESEPEKGSTFHFTLPINESVLKKSLEV